MPVTVPAPPYYDNSAINMLSMCFKTATLQPSASLTQTTERQNSTTDI